MPLTFNINAKSSTNPNINSSTKPDISTNSNAKLKSVNSTLASVNSINSNTNSTHTILLTQNENQAQSNEIQTTSNQNAEFQNSNAEFQSSSTEIQSYELEETTIEARIDEASKYNSGTSVRRDTLDSIPNGNGDITSALKILPNVQFDNAHASSLRPGEIDPANISISGGLYYQNNFQLDGFNINNDLNPNGGRPSFNGQGLSGSLSQGLNIDSSLLESITVQDSNIGAAYGGFTGGVVEAKVRNPRTDGWHFDVSYQHTSSKLTEQHIDESARNDFENSYSHFYQPKFIKHSVRTSFEGYINEKLGIIGSFNTIYSKIPLHGYSDLFQYAGYEKDKITSHTRRSDNYFLKAIYNLKDNFTIEANLAYMPQFNRYFWAGKDAFYTMKSGGWQSGLTGTLDDDLGLWTNQLGFSRLQHSRVTDKNYYISWSHSADRNWAVRDNGAVSEGGPYSIEQLQQSWSYKSDMLFKPKQFVVEHNFRVGAEFDYKNASNGILKDYYMNRNWTYNGTQSNMEYGINSCVGSDDFLGISLCSTEPILTGANAGKNGQWVKRLFLMSKDEPRNNVKLDMFSYAAYVEDDMKIFDSKKVGVLSTRLGLRFDGDSYMSKKVLAPRFSLAYTTAAAKEFQSKISFGANRYYARNLFSYKLSEMGELFTKVIERATLGSPWVESAYDDTSNYSFNKLKIPYSDELMVGFSQNIGIFNVNTKYINRQGKDELIRRASPTRWTNDGSSKSHIISLILENTEIIDFANVKNHFLFAFDYTLVNRTYNIQDSSSEDWVTNPDIFYNGKIIKYRERPTENFARPYTIRLNTTHHFNLGRTTFLLNNFFRYRSGYDRMVRLVKNNTYTSPNYNPNIDAGITQYGRYHFKGAFIWDMRVGFERNINKGSLYMNFDINNVLNLKNLTNYTQEGSLYDLVQDRYSTPMYETGRQLWIQIGYKY